MDIDDLLAQSAPPGADRTPELKEALRLLAEAAESQARAARRTRRTLLIGATSAIVVLGLAAATAPGLIPGWVPWTTGEGSSCTMLFDAKPHLSDGEPIDYVHLPTVVAAAAEEANRFFATFDLDSIDEERAIQEWQLAEDAVIASVPPREQQPRLAGDDLALNAMWWKVNHALDAHLASVGLPTGGEAVSVSMTWQCE